MVSKTLVKTHLPSADYLLKSADGRWVALEIKALKKGAAKAAKTKASAQAFLQKHGFVTKAGKLTKPYRG